MKKEVTACDSCQQEGIDRVATKWCGVCGADYCEEHARSISVLIESGPDSSCQQLGVRDSFEVCPKCRGLLGFDNWTTGEVSTRGAMFDRPIIKLILPRALTVVRKSLMEVSGCIGSGDVREWVELGGADMQGLFGWKVPDGGG